MQSNYHNQNDNQTDYGMNSISQSLDKHIRGTDHKLSTLDDKQKEFFAKRNPSTETLESSEAGLKSMVDNKSGNSESAPSIDQYKNEALHQSPSIGQNDAFSSNYESNESSTIDSYATAKQNEAVPSHGSQQNNDVFDADNRLQTKVEPRKDSLQELADNKYANSDLQMLQNKIDSGSKETLQLANGQKLSTMTDNQGLKTSKDNASNTAKTNSSEKNIKNISDKVGTKNKTLFDKNQTKLSKGITLNIKGLKGLNKTAGTGLLAGSAVVKGLTENIDDDKRTIESLKRTVSKPVQKASREVTGKIKRKVIQTSYKAMKKGIKFALKAFVTALRAIVAKIAVLAGSSLAFLLPIIIVLLCITVFLSTFTGSEKSKTQLDTLFNAVQTEYNEKAQEERDKLEAKKHGQPGKGEFENISDEEYQDLIATQWKPDMVTQYGSSNIDFKAQLALMQILSGANDAANDTSLSDLMTVEKYWMDQGIVESYSNSTSTNSYTVTWTAKKDENINESATASSSAEAENQVKAKVDAHATNGYKITDKSDVKYDVKTNYETVEDKDEDGKVIGHHQEVKDYTATAKGKIHLEKEMSKNLTQYIYTLIFENGDLQDYLDTSNEAYKNDVKLKVSDLTLGKETSFVSAITTGEQEANKKAIWALLKDNGFTEEAAAGVMGNLYVESHFDPGIVQGGGDFVWNVTGYGLAQWTTQGRQQNLFNHCSQLGKPRDDLSAQMDFLMNVEMPAWNWGSYFNSLDDLKKCTDINKVCEAFMLCFERPADQGSVAINTRCGYAKDIYNQLKGSSVSGITTSSDVGTIISVSSNSSHYGKSYLFEELISNQSVKSGEALNEGDKETEEEDTSVVPDEDIEVTPDGEDIVPEEEEEEKQDKSNNKDKIDKASEEQIRQLYSSPLLLDGFTVKGSGGGSVGSTGGILEIGGVKVDFGSKYYTYNANGIDGSPNVCDAANTTGWPYSDCAGLSYTGSWNKMICSSYASSRYWEVNYPDDPYPLPSNWDQKLTIDHVAPGPGQYSTDPTKPIAKSIISITFGGVMHDAFIEGVGEDGSVVISECNATTDNQYGFRVRKFSSLQEFLDSYGAVLNGMYGPEK